MRLYRLFVTTATVLSAAFTLSPIIITGAEELNLDQNQKSNHKTPKKAKNPANKKYERYEPPKFSQQSIDLNTKKLPPKYLGHDLESIVENLAMREMVLKKSEFETTAEFNKRVESNKNRDIIGKLSVNDFFVQILSEDIDVIGEIIPSGRPWMLDWLQDPTLESKYNADEHTFLIKIKDNPNRSQPDMNIAVMPLYITKVFPPYEDGDDTAKHKLVNGYNIEFINLKNSPEILLTDLSISRAKELKYGHKLRAAAIYKVQPPYVAQARIPEGSEGSEGSILVANRIYAVISEIWLYNFETGEILKKQKI